MKKIIILVISLLFLLGCNGKEKEVTQVKEYVLSEFRSAYPNEEFYFIYGPDYNSEYNQTNIRYRGILSTKTLEDLDYHSGFQVNLENVNSSIDTRKYQNTLNYLEIYAPLKREAKKIFGQNIIFELEGGYTSAMCENILKRMGQNMSRDKKTGLGMIVFSAFVDDLDQELKNIDYWKNGLYQLGKKYWEHYNITGALQIYLYDKELLRNTKLLEASLGLTASNDKIIIESLKKIDEEKDLTLEEESYILSKIGTGDIFMREVLWEDAMIGLKFFTSFLENENELNEENVKIMD